MRTVDTSIFFGGCKAVGFAPRRRGDRVGVRPSRLASPADERQVERLAVEVGEDGRRRRMTFVADFEEHSVFGPSGRRLPLTWQRVMGVLRERGVDVRALRNGEVVIANHAGRIVVRRR